MSPFMSVDSFVAPASSSSWIVSSLANAAARCNGVSALVRQSRMNASVSTPGFVATFGLAPALSSTRTTRWKAGLLAVHNAACSAVSPVWGSVRLTSAPC